MDTTLTPCTWKHGKRWAYTVTYDEAMAELFDYTVPVHEELGIPGHVEVVVGHMGKVRQIGQSSYNGYHHMDAGQLRQLIALGWGVGSHSWSHGVVAENLDLEVRQAKQVLEDAIGCRVVTYVAPGDNSNMIPPVIEALQAAGYLSALSVTDDINPPDCNLWFLNRSANLHRGWGPLFSAFDPYHRLEQARAQSAWVVDYCHCPTPHIPHESKDVYIHEHRARLEAIVRLGGNEVWPATVEEIVDYVLCRRHVRIEPVTGDTGEPSFRLSLPDLPAPVTYRHLTVDIQIPPPLRRCPQIIVSGRAQPALLVERSVARLTLDLAQPVMLAVTAAGQ
ncbi:MAG: polysaccharide deacetylase family protein [Anaerolineae bacterium]|nr:polysaccharide deacetylase family protein [Anaerolineae bacterium]